MAENEHLPRVHLIHADDWVRLYVDGKLVDEGHSLSERMVAEAIVGAAHVTTEEMDAEDYDGLFWATQGLDLPQVEEMRPQYEH